MITWETVALGLLSFCTGIAGWLLKELTTEVRKLANCVAKQSERWVQHDDKHRELRDDRLRNEKDLWDAVADLRKVGHK